MQTRMSRAEAGGWEESEDIEIYLSSGMESVKD